MPLTQDQREAILRAVAEDRFDDFLVLRRPSRNEPKGRAADAELDRRSLRTTQSETLQLLKLLTEAVASAARDARRPALNLLMRTTLRDVLDRILPMIEIVEESDRRVFSSAALKMRDEAYLRWWADTVEVICIDREAWEQVRSDMENAQNAHITREFVKAFPEIELGHWTDDYE